MGAGTAASPLGSVDPRPVRLTADLNSIVGTVAITGLNIALLANKNYVFEFHLFMTTATNSPNFQIRALAAGAALVFVNAQLGFDAGLSLSNEGTVTAVTTNITGANTSNISNWVVNIYGCVTVGINATTLGLDFVNTGTTDKIKTGSWGRAATVA